MDLLEFADSTIDLVEVADSMDLVEVADSAMALVEVACTLAVTNLLKEK